MLHYTCGRVVQRRERNEVLQEWEWMTDEHRNTVGSNTDSFHKAVFLIYFFLVWVFWFFLIFFFFLAATVNISKCHKIEQHKEIYAAPTEFTFIRGWIVQWQVLGCLTWVLMGQQIFLEYLRLPRWAPIHLLLQFLNFFFFLHLHLQIVVGKMTSLNCYCTWWCFTVKHQFRIAWWH